MKNKKACTFVQFHIEEFYPSISKSLLEKALLHAMKYTPISNETLNTNLHTRKSLLFTDQEAWVKKSGNPKFDVTMGSYDGAEFCELQWSPKVLGHFAICYSGLNFHPPPPPKQCCFMDEVHAILD